MSLEASAPVSAPEASPVDSSPEQGLDTPQESSEASEASTGPEESFQAWLARQEGSKEPKAPKEKPDTESVSSKEPKDEDKAAEAEEPASKEAPQEPKVKVGDKEYTHKEISERLSAADQTSKQYETLQGQAKQLVEMLKNDPGAVLAKVGANREALENWYYKNYIEPDTLSPEQLETRNLKDRVSEYEAKEAAQAKQAEAAKAEKAAQQKEADKERYRSEWSTKIQEALETSGLPKSDWTVTRMALYLKQALQQGRKDVQPSDVAKQVKADWAAAQKDLLANLTPAQLAAQLGDEALAKIRQHDVEKYKSTKFENKNPGQGKARTVEKETKKYSSIYKMLEDL